MSSKGINTEVSTKGLIFDSVNFAFLLSVAGLVAQRPDDEQLMAWIRNWSAPLFVLAAAIIGGLLTFLINKQGVKTLGELIFEAPHKKANNLPVVFWRTFWGWQLIVSALITMIIGVALTRFSFYDLFYADGFNSALRLFTGLASPELSILPKAIIKIIETIFIALVATAIAVPLAFFLSFASAKNIMTHPAAFAVYGTLRSALNLVRSIEPIIWAIIFSVWVGIGPFAGMLALMVHSVASLAKQYSELVESVSEGPIEGIKATGATPIQIIWYAIVPQVMLPFISFTIYRWDINVRMATIIGFVGGGGIGTLLNQYALSAMWPEVGCLVLVIALVVWIMDITSAYIREALK